MTFIPWNLATLAGVILGAQIADPARLGIDVIFPAAMVGLAVGLITGRRELVAAIVAPASRSSSPWPRARPIGIVAGGVIGPAVGLLVPAAHRRRDGAARDARVGGALLDAGRARRPGPRRSDRRRPGAS